MSEAVPPSDKDGQNHQQNPDSGIDVLNKPAQSSPLKSVKKTAWKLFARTGSFSIVLLATIVVVIYFAAIASDRYATDAQFMIKESGAQTELSGLAALGAVSSTARNSLVIKAFIESREMAEALDDEIGLKGHFQNPEVDWFSRLSVDASAEQYYEYYLQRVSVYHDEMSDVVEVEVQAFTPEYSMLLAQSILDISERFINELGDKMAKEQVRYAESEVQRAHQLLKDWQQKLLVFQEQNQLFDPEQEGGAILNGINQLQLELIKSEARLKELTAVLREDSSEVKAQKNLIQSLQQQLSEERQRMTDENDGGFNKINIDFQEITLGAELAGELYKSSLVGLDTIRSQALQKLKHLLVIERPLLAQESRYPDRLYNIISWFVGLLILYFIFRMVVAIVNEHKD